MIFSRQLEIQTRMEKQSIDPTQIGVPKEIGNFTVRKISWNDFKGKGPDNCWFLSHIYWAINYETVIQKDRRPTVLVDTKILPKSWVNHEGKDYKLLRHEYGHYLIGCLCALSFQKKINTRKQPNINFSQWCRNVLRQTIDEYHKIEKLYDQQTYHYLNQENQIKWNKSITRQLNEFKQEIDRNQPIKQGNNIIKDPNLKKNQDPPIKREIIKKEQNRRKVGLSLPKVIQRV